MKKTIIVIALFIPLTCLYSQDKKLEKLKAEFTDGICKSIDSIDTRNKTAQTISAEVNSRIDRSVMLYMLSKSLFNVSKNKPDTLKININTNKESKAYKDAYYELETYLMENCKALKNKIASHDIYNDLSMTQNEEALGWYTKGQDELKAENYSKAIKFFCKAMAIDPRFTFGWDNLGLCYRKTNQLDLAIDAYRKSLELDPKGVTPLQNIAVAYSYQKNYTEAIKAYNRLAEVHKGDPEVFYGLSLIYIEQNDLENALISICKAYLMYIEIKSPYRSDAEKVFGTVYHKMKAENKEARFYEICKEYKINVN